MIKHCLPHRRWLMPSLPLLATWMLLGCGASKPEPVAPQPLPPSQSPAPLSNLPTSQQQVTAAQPAAAPSVTVQRRYQCPTPQGVEWLEVTYQGASPQEANGLTLQRAGTRWEFRRMPLVGNALFLANDDNYDYRWLVADNGLGSLRVRAPIRTAVETEVLGQCQAVDNPQG